jgi:ABC-type multidrug transport system ATPase subunit
MRISLSDAGKRFNREWIFRKFSYVFETNNAYAIVGPNGSGKSTLLQVIGGAMIASEGKIEYHISGKDYSSDDIFRNISIAAPYLELIEEMTVLEFLSFHQTFKPFKDGFSIPSIIKVVGLEKASNKQIRYYSSGMKQRVKLAQAIFSDTDCLLLDEPCTNLDAEGIDLYQRLITSHSHNRLVIVSSNDEQEYGFCKEKINVMEWK